MERWQTALIVAGGVVAGVAVGVSGVVVAKKAGLLTFEFGILKI